MTSENDLIELFPKLVALVRTVESGSFSAAGREMSLSPSTISRQIDTLERALNVVLFNRTTRKLHITEAGQEVYERTVALISSTNALFASAKSYSDTPQGLLRITAPVTLGKMVFAPFISSFLASYPGINVEMYFSDQLVDLVEERYDLSVRVTSQPPEHMVARPLMPIRYVLVCSADYASPLPTQPEDLSAHTFLLPEDCQFKSSYKFQNNEQERFVHLEPRLIINNSEAMLDSLFHGIGVALLPYFVAEKFLLEGRLTQLLPDWHMEAGEQKTAYILTLPNRLLPLKTRVFIDHLVKFLKEKPVFPTRLQ